MAISYRPTYYGNREASPNGKNSHERFTVLSKTSVEADGNESQSVSSDRPPSTHRVSVVVRYDKSHSGSPHAPSESGHSDFHGLLNGGLGIPYTEPGSVRGMVAQRENITHKQFRAKDSSSSSKTYWERVVIGKTILVASDNSTVVAYINKQGGTVSRSLCMEAKEMLIWCHQREIILRARYIPGKLNALADQLSRRGQILHTEWSLCPRIFKQLCNQFTKPMWDLFATKYNKKLEIYASPMPDPESEAVDALSLSWENMWAYAYPPTALIPQILTNI